MLMRDNGAFIHSVIADQSMPNLLSVLILDRVIWVTYVWRAAKQHLS